MPLRLKQFYFVLMLAALVFGFLHLFADAGPYNFERLHVFLFNLCAGGSVILFFSETPRRFSPRVFLFMTLALAYAVFAFFQFYIPAVMLSLVLALIVESIRVQRFSLFPWGFFRADEPVDKKFHQAALLCLSLGLAISAAVIINNEYLELVSFPKLQLDVFFLGFSFPVSLITLSLIFSFMDGRKNTGIRILKEIGFWAVNLGVIIFFLFIIFEKLSSQVIVTLILFAAVAMITVLYYRLGKTVQQKHFLTSGMGFLLITAVTGIGYIFAEMGTGYTGERYHWLLKLHAFASLYGWNLCGLAVIFRYDDFPITLHSRPLIVFHWITALVLAPLGIYFPLFSLMAVACYGVLLYAILFASKATREMYTS
ncbi:MAG: hypothetical protein ACOZBW_02435 [Thermodesulfobacteriota bacterium]